MKNSLSTLLFILVFFTRLSAQSTDFQFIDYDYTTNIKSVRFHLTGLFLSAPVVDLNSEGTLMLSFDDLDADVKNYSYRLIHCDADWKPSNLSYFEYMDGFDEANILDYNYSFNTISEYTHYTLYLPNRDVRWTKSGNYLLVVFENSEETTPVITRRFVVVEPVVRVEPRFVIPSIVSKNRTHQEIDFVVYHQGVDLRNPRQSITATVLQNNRWDNAATGIPPFFVRSNEQIDFDYQNRIVFAAGREWRQLDLRSFRFPSPDVYSVERFDDGYYVTLAKERKRSSQPHLNITDLNGSYVIENRDQADPELSGEYANVLFTLVTPTEYPDADVYIFGDISNWQLKDEYKMAYNRQHNAYVGSIQLKQGFYNYAYVVASADKKQVDYEEMEGNWFETENEYTVLIYYRPIGERYDRVIGAYTFNSRR